MSNIIKTIKYSKVPAGEFKWLFVAVSLLTKAIAKVGIGEFGEQIKNLVVNIQMLTYFSS